MNLISKRVLAMLLTVLMVVQLLPVSVLAEGKDVIREIGAATVSSDSGSDSGKSTEPKSDKQESGSNQDGKSDSSASASSSPKEEPSGKTDGGDSAAGSGSASGDSAAPAQDSGTGSGQETSGTSQDPAPASSDGSETGDGNAASSDGENGEKEESEEENDIAYRSFQSSNSGTHLSVKVSGKYVKGQKAPSVKKVSVGALEAWTVQNVSGKLSMTAKVKSVPSLEEGETLAFYNVHGSSLGSMLRKNVSSGDSISITLSKGTTGVALVKIAAPVEDNRPVLHRTGIQRQDIFLLHAQNPFSPFFVYS